MAKIQESPLSLAKKELKIHKRDQFIVIVRNHIKKSIFKLKKC